MKQKNNIIFICIVVAIIVSIGINIIAAQQHRGNETGVANSGLEEKTLTVGTTTLQVEIAQTAEQKITGLSHRLSLAEGRGMFFIFDTDGRHGIWMKDMEFPIDIIWIDAAMKVVHIEKSVAPDTYPQTFTTPTPARYVLEVPAGYAKGRIAVGDAVVLN